MPPLENLHAEIWAQILDIACLDDGFTARSLSLVSRQIHHLSRNHLYHSVKVDSTSQLFKLEDQISKSIPDSAKGNGHFLKTRFLCIRLPTRLVAEAYPEESFVPERIPGDTPYRPTRWSGSGDDTSLYSHDSSDMSDAHSNNDESDEDEQNEQDLRQELAAELADITNDPACKNLGRITMSSLEDLLNYPHYSLELYVYRVYSSLRRLLDACASTLQVLSLYFNPWKLMPIDLFLPPLPNLERLSIYVREAYQWSFAKRTPQELTARPPLLFPSLRVLRMVDHFPFWFKGEKVEWWADIVRSCGNPTEIQIVTGEKVPQAPDWKSSVKGAESLGYLFLTAQTLNCLTREDRGSEIALEWWLDDIKGTPPVLHAVIADRDDDNDIYTSEGSNVDVDELQRDDTPDYLDSD